jgi:hypothetical protein
MFFQIVQVRWWMLFAPEQKQIILNWKSYWSSSYDSSNQTSTGTVSNKVCFFTMTINKSQGQTLTSWAYTCLLLVSFMDSLAMSRVKMPTSLKALIVHCNDSNSTPSTTDNVVHQEVFQ